MELLGQFDLYKFLVILHVAGTAIGVGGATFSDLVFFRSIKDGIISQDEFNLMKLGGVAIWGGLALLILSGGGIVAYQFSQGEILWLTSTKVQSKLVIVSIIAANGVLIHAKILPLFKSSVGKYLTQDVLPKHSGLIFTSGAVSATSWYSAMIIGAWRGLTASPFVILAVYFGLMLIGVITAQIIGKIKVAEIQKMATEVDSTTS